MHRTMNNSPDGNGKPAAPQAARTWNEQRDGRWGERGGCASEKIECEYECKNESENENENE